MKKAAPRDGGCIVQMFGFLCGVIFAKFIVFIAIWTGAAGLLIGTFHPLAIFFVWIVGFLWGTGYIIGGTRDGDALVSFVGGYWIGLALICVLIVAAIS